MSPCVAWVEAQPATLLRIIRRWLYTVMGTGLSTSHYLSELSQQDGGGGSELRQQSSEENAAKQGGRQLFDG